MREKKFSIIITLLFSLVLFNHIQSALADTPISTGFDYPVGYTAEKGYADGTGYNVTVGLGFLELWDYENSKACDEEDPTKYCEYHPGEDWNGDSNDAGDPIYAISNGTIRYAGYHSASWGNLVLIHHKAPPGQKFISPDGVEVDAVWSQYGHLATLAEGIETNEVVRRGQQIGTVGDFPYGSMSNYHLHFEIRKQDRGAAEFVSNTEKDESDYQPWPRVRVVEYYADPSGFIHLNHPQAPLAGDWNDNGRDTIGLYKPREKRFLLDNNTDNNIVGDVNVQFGILGDISITGDWNGDGQDTIGVYRPTTTEFFLDNNNNGTADVVKALGNTGDIPIVGDWDGDGQDTIGVYRPTTTEFFLDNNNNGTADVVKALGNTGDIPIVGDWDGDGDDDIGIFRPQDPTVNTNTFYLDLNLTGGVAELGPYQFGDKDDLPVIGDWDGDGDDDIGVYRSSIKEFFLEPNNIDVALIIDSSGSMTWNDPKNLRKEAAEIFVGVAQNEDQIAIIDFDSYMKTLWHLQPLTENRDGIIAAINSIDSSGGTNIGRGLLGGYYELLSSSEPNSRAAVLLTDGDGSYYGEAELFKTEGWPIHTIGLGSSANSALLKNIADETGGIYFPLNDANQLKNVYFEIATHITGGTSIFGKTLYMLTGDFYELLVNVPLYQQMVTFLISWPGSDVSTTLVTPSGRQITPDTIDTDVYHAKGLTYELYRINNPEPGEWAVGLTGVDLSPGGEEVSVSASSVGPPVPVDTTPPIISISNPVNGKTYFDQLPTNFNFMIEDPESAIVSQSALLNGVPINNNDSILLVQLGENTLTITATNEANLTSELSIIFYVNHFTWLPPIKYEKGSATQTLTYIAQANSTLPIKFAIFNADDSFIADTSVKVIVEGTTAQFLNGEGDTNIRINQEEGEDPLYIVNLHTNFNKCDYGLEAGNEYNLTVYFNDILAARAKLRIE